MAKFGKENSDKKEKRPFGEHWTGIFAENTGKEICVRTTDDAVGILSEGKYRPSEVEAIYVYKKDLSRLIDHLRRLL